MRKKVSIIIPTYNRSHLILETLDSVISQTYQNWECIVVDDGSTDNTEELLQIYTDKDQRIRILNRPDFKMKGANSCRNFGVDSSTGDFFLFLDSDDILSNDCLENRILFLENENDLDFAVFDMGLLNNDGFQKYVYPDLKSKSVQELISLFIMGPLPWNMTRPFWRKEFFIKVGYFNENLKMFDDDEFNLRVIYGTKCKFKFANITDCYYRIYQENKDKYNDKKFKIKLFASHLEFLKSIDILFKEEDKVFYSKYLQSNLFKIMDAFLIRDSQLIYLFKQNLQFAENNFKFSFKFYLLMRIKLYLQRFSPSIKGWYTFNKFLDLQLHR